MGRELHVWLARPCSDVAPELERLKVKGVARSRDFLMDRIYDMRKPKTNLQASRPGGGLGNGGAHNTAAASPLGVPTRLRLCHAHAQCQPCMRDASLVPDCITAGQFSVCPALHDPTFVRVERSSRGGPLLV